MSNNPFNQGKNSMNLEMLKQYRTKPLIKYSVSAFCGLLSFILLITLVSTTDVHFEQWSNGHATEWTVSYGILWLIGFGALAFNIILASLIVRFFSDVKIDTIPLVVSWSFAAFSFLIIPAPIWAEFLLIPLFAIIGFIAGMVGVLFFSLYKFTKEARKNPNNGQNPFASMGPNGPYNNNNPNINDPNSHEEKHEDNPFVDIEDEDNNNNAE